MLTVNDGPLPAGSHAPSQRSARKGKERQRESDLVPLSRSGWTQWVVDPHEAHRGAEVWTRSERVILVMGGEFCSQMIKPQRQIGSGGGGGGPERDE
jgi:hypothetical protein